MSLDDETSGAQPRERILGDLALDLGVIAAWVGVFRIEEPGIQTRFIRKQEEPLAVEIEASDRINAGRKTTGRERDLTFAVLRELREHAVGFVQNE